jgi:hypothetical protein
MPSSLPNLLPPHTRKSKDPATVTQAPRAKSITRPVESMKDYLKS